MSNALILSLTALFYMFYIFLLMTTLYFDTPSQKSRFKKVRPKELSKRMSIYSMIAIWLIFAIYILDYYLIIYVDPHIGFRSDFFLIGGIDTVGVVFSMLGAYLNEYRIKRKGSS